MIQRNSVKTAKDLSSTATNMKRQNCRKRNGERYRDEKISRVELWQVRKIEVQGQAADTRLTG